VDILKILMQSGYDLSNAHSNLIIAAKTGATEVVDAVLSHFPKLPRIFREHCLQYCCQNGHLETVRLLVTKTPRIGLEEALHNASLYGHVDIVTYLLDNKASINDTQYGGETPLANAASRGHHDIVHLLLAAGAAVDYASPSLLRSASKGGCVALVSQLLWGEAESAAAHLTVAGDVSTSTCRYNKDTIEDAIADTRGAMATHPANSAGVVEELLRYAQERFPDETPDIATRIMFLPMLLGRADIVDLLLDANACIHRAVPTGSRLSALGFAVQSGSVKAVSSLLSNPDQALTDTHLREALARASVPAVVQLLLDAKADAGAGDSLRYACKRASPEAVRLLLAAGAKAGGGDDADCDPLHTAVTSTCDADMIDDKIAVINMLLDAGAETRTGGSSSWSILHACVVSTRTGPRTMQALLHRDAGLLDARDHNHMTPLALAAQYKHVDKVEFLINSGADVNAVDSTGKPVIAYACEFPDDFDDACPASTDAQRTLRLLLAAGADVTAVAVDGAVTAAMELVDEDNVLYDHESAHLLAEVAEAVLSRR
jgi:ankyrin repeat protein